MFCAGQDFHSALCFLYSLFLKGISKNSKIEAPELRKTGVYISVNEDFEEEGNDEIGVFRGSQNSNRLQAGRMPYIFTPGRDFQRRLSILRGIFPYPPCRSRQSAQPAAACLLILLVRQRSRPGIPRIISPRYFSGRTRESKKL